MKLRLDCIVNGLKYEPLFKFVFLDYNSILFSNLDINGD